MSNVLIGIIGVILFIGLALAGALILGDDFKTASSASQAAALMSQIKQTADAADMRKLKLGSQHSPSTGTEFLVPRFLRTPATNPTSWGRQNAGSYVAQVVFNNNLFADAGPEPGAAALMVMAVVGPATDARSHDTCQTINDTYGSSAIQDFSATNIPDPDQHTGCIKASSGIGAVYIAYQRIENRSMSPFTPYAGP